MTFPIKSAFILFILFLSCNTGNLEIIADIPNHLKEVSAVEIIEGSKLFWVIEDAGKGDRNVIYGIDKKGKIKTELRVKDSKNRDWEDLTSDKQGNLYVGDFGNNSEKHKTFSIYKISNILEAEDEVTAERIKFTLPKKIKSADFEAFFEYNGYFYMFSKAKKKALVLKVPNEIGEHEATFVTKFELEGKERRITSADISEDGKQMALLTHDKAWIIAKFKADSFFDGKIKTIDFDHNSQKEGICFKDKETLIITDERSGGEGGNIYSMNIK